MKSRHLNRYINKYFKLFRNNIYVDEILMVRLSDNTIDHDTIMARMTTLRLIKQSNRMVHREWTLDEFGHTVIKYYTWRIYLAVDFVKGLIKFWGGLWTIGGTIGTLVFGYLTIKKDNRLEKEILLNKRLEQRLDSVNKSLDLKEEEYRQTTNKVHPKNDSTDSLDTDSLGSKVIVDK